MNQNLPSFGNKLSVKETIQAVDLSMLFWVVQAKFI